MVLVVECYKADVCILIAKGVFVVQLHVYLASCYNYQGLQQMPCLYTNIGSAVCLMSAISVEKGDIDDLDIFDIIQDHQYTFLQQV